MSLFLSQKKNINPLLAKLLLIRKINSDEISNYLKPNIANNIPNPFLLKDMEKSVDRVILAIRNKEKIGIIADYDVDGSTSASILYKFLKNFTNDIFIKVPNRLSEGYGPNFRIMDDFLEKNIDLIFSLDCGTSSFNIIDNKKYSNIDVIVIDHHLSEPTMPDVFSIINPNRFDEDSDYVDLAAVGVTYLFLMALRKKMRKIGYFNEINEPNLLYLLDLVALGTVCDVVNLSSYNRVFVSMGLDLINKRKNTAISKILDNSNINKTPNAGDIGYLIGPQLNAASRVDDSSLPYKLLISKSIDEIDKISRKLILLNEKRKLIENNVYEDALLQAEKQTNENFILVYGNDWHNGVLGIIASRLINKFNKPTIVISFINSIGVGSARSIKSIDLGNLILNAKNENIINGGGGHKMAAGLQINKNQLSVFINFLKKNINFLPINIFQKKEIFDLEISSDEINNDLLSILELMEPFGSGNSEPKFIIKDIKIDHINTLKNKHLLLIFHNNLGSTIKGICFNCVGTFLGDYLLSFKNYKFAIGCTIRRDNFTNSPIPQIIIQDAMIID